MGLQNGPGPRSGGRLRPCSPFFLLLLITVLAAVVVVQEITMQSATHTETYYRKALFAFDRRGQAVAAGFEEFATAQTFKPGAKGGGSQGAAGVRGGSNVTAGGAGGSGGGAAAAAEQQQVAGTERPLEDRATMEQQPGAAMGAEQQQQQQQQQGAGAAGVQETSQQAATAAAAAAAAKELAAAEQRAETALAVATATQQLMAADVAAAAAVAAATEAQQQQQEQQQVGAGSMATAGATATEQQQQQAEAAAAAGRLAAAAQQAGAGGAAGTAQQAATTAAVAAAAGELAAAEQRADTLLAAAAAAAQLKAADAAATEAAAAAGGSGTQQGSMAGAGAQQAGATAAGAVSEAQQAAAAAFAMEQATVAAATEEEAAAAAAAAAQREQAEKAAAAAAAAASAAKQATAAAATAQVAAAAAGGDEVQPAGPVEDEWWSALGEPRKRPAEMPHGVTVRLVQPDALRAVPEGGVPVGGGAAAAGAAGSGGAAAGGACKIYVLDAAREFGPLVGAPICDVNSPFIWPFSAPGRGIDGAQQLAHQDSQYASGHWITEAIRGSAYEALDLADADFVYVDMHCYHTWWMSWHHPLGSRNMTDPTRYIQRTYEMLQDMPRFMDSRGADFGLLQPGPTLGGLFSEAVLCEDLASVYHMVTERSSLCVWTRDSAERGKALVLPYVATTDLGLELPEELRNIFLYFRGGCGNPDPAVRPLFAAGKMLRYWLVEKLQGKAADVEVACSCDICENHEPHALLLAKMRRSVFCPVVSSNVQSSRRLSEAVLAGCIPVFIGPPFHALPLAQHVDYPAMSVFITINDTDPWIDRASVRWEHNHMISKAWKLDDAVPPSAVASVPTLDDVLPYLRALPAEVVAAKQAALRRERPKFYYPPAVEEGAAPGVAPKSVLGELILGEMCARGAEAKRRRAAAAQHEGRAVVLPARRQLRQ